MFEKELLLASTNPGKAQEIAALFAQSGWRLYLPNELPAVANLEVEEDAETLRGNALKKAQAYGDLSGKVTLADDTGLMVNALGGRPGVHSKRFAPTADERNKKVIAELTTQQSNDWSAYFLTVMVIYDPKTKQFWEFDGELKGVIAQTISHTAASEGVGYDAVFIPEGFERPLSELGFEQKQAISHRSNALRKAIAFLESQYGSGTIPLSTQ